MFTFLLAQLLTAAQPCPASDAPAVHSAYRSESGDIYLVRNFDREEETRLFFSDYRQMWRGPLAVRDDGRLILDAQGGPVLGFLCERDEVTGLTVTYADGEALQARRIALTVREEQFSNAGRVMSGVFYAPLQGRQRPGIVFVHGSGPSTNADFSEWGLYLASHGIASIAYDKQGTGGSEGDWQNASFDDLALDAEAALRALRLQPEIAPGMTGYLGASQGGWVAPIAAARTDPAFMIISGGGPVSPAIQERYRRLRLVEESGASAQERNAAAEILALWFEYLRDPDGHADAVSTAWRDYRVAEQSWRQLIGVPSRDPTTGPWPDVRIRFARELHFDPLPDYLRSDMPLLGLIGLEDQAFPVDATLAGFAALPPERDLSLVVIPHVDHGYFMELGPGRRNQPPEVFEAMIGWIRIKTDPAIVP